MTGRASSAKGSAGLRRMLNIRLSVPLSVSEEEA
jgi:hypothetical protein